MSSILASFITGQQAGQQNRTYQQEQSKLAQLRELAPSVLAGDPAAYAQSMALDSAHTTKLQDGRAKQLGQLEGMVKFVDAARATNDPRQVAGAMRSIAPFIKTFAGVDIDPDQPWTPEYDTGWEAFKAQIAGARGGGGSEQFTLGPGSKRFDAAGNVIAEVPFAPASGTLVDVPDGMGGTMKMVWDPRTRQLSDLPQVGGAGLTYEDGSPAILSSGRAPDGTPFRFDPGMSKEDLETALADIANGGTLTTAALPARDAPPQQGARPGRIGYNPPKQQERYTTLSAGDVAALGLPEGTVAQRSPTGQVQVVSRPSATAAGGQVIDNGDGTTTYIPPGKISEGERNASGFYQRMIAANAEMQELEQSGYDPTNRRDYYTAGGELLNPLASPEGQRYRQAQNNWLRANLRKESGAVIGVEEMNEERKNYFPIPGDTPAVIEQKRRNRITTERAMRAAAGAGLPPVGQEPAPTRPAAQAGQQRPVMVNSPAEYNALPAGSLYTAPDGSTRRKK